MLYRGMDRAQLDAAYNNSAAVRIILHQLLALLAGEPLAPPILLALPDRSDAIEP